MVALAVKAFGGVIKPSNAAPMLRASNDAFLAGRTIEAAAKLREALRRHLAAFCSSCRLDTEGDAATLLERLKASGFTVSSFIGDALTECEDILTLRDRGKYFAVTLDCAFEVIPSDSRKGGAL